MNKEYPNAPIQISHPEYMAELLQTALPTQPATSDSGETSTFESRCHPSHLNRLSHQKIIKSNAKNIYECRKEIGRLSRSLSQLNKHNVEENEIARINVKIKLKKNYEFIIMQYSKDLQKLYKSSSGSDFMSSKKTFKSIRECRQYINDHHKSLSRFEKQGLKENNTKVIRTKKELIHAYEFMIRECSVNPDYKNIDECEKYIEKVKELIYQLKEESLEANKNNIMNLEIKFHEANEFRKRYYCNKELQQDLSPKEKQPEVNYTNTIEIQEHINKLKRAIRYLKKRKPKEYESRLEKKEDELKQACDHMLKKAPYPYNISQDAYKLSNDSEVYNSIEACRASITKLNQSIGQLRRFNKNKKNEATIAQKRSELGRASEYLKKHASASHETIDLTSHETIDQSLSSPEGSEIADSPDRVYFDDEPLVTSWVNEDSLEGTVMEKDLYNILADIENYNSLSPWDLEVPSSDQRHISFIAQKSLKDSSLSANSEDSSMSFIAQESLKGSSAQKPSEDLSLEPEENEFLCTTTLEQCEEADQIFKFPEIASPCLSTK